MRNVRNGPVVIIGKPAHSVTKVIVTTPQTLHTIGSRETGVRRELSPCGIFHDSININSRECLQEKVSKPGSTWHKLLHYINYQIYQWNIMQHKSLCQVSMSELHVVSECKWSTSYLTVLLIVWDDKVVATIKNAAKENKLGNDTGPTWLDIGTLLLVVLTPGGIVGEDGNIPPGSGVPVGVVIPLLWALIATAIAVAILTGEASIESVIEILKDLTASHYWCHWWRI